MGEITIESPAGSAWPSIEDAKPDEEGGPIARVGFNYQDEIAVSFLIEMLETPALLKVHCETHDDVVLLRQNGSAQRSAEFVQVKASEQDKLWSIADISQRKNGKVGTSIFEISLGRDKHDEASTFRLVTLRPVVSGLEPLTYPCGAEGRSFDTDEMKAISAELEKRFPGIASAKGNGSSCWLENCFWDQRHSEQAVCKDNLLRLIQLSAREGRPLLPEAVEVLLQELRALAKAAGAAKWIPDRAKKIVERETVRAWWDQRTDDLATGAAASGGKLASKMEDAVLPGEVIGLAVELRRGYAAASRTSRYLEPDEAERLQRRVQSEVMSLRSRFVAGQLDLSGPEFHALCLERMDAVNAERGANVEDQSAFLKGCMYDIADRCLLRFARPV
ncbi:MAG TPA: dsDNA nuclease domain-containing protein [Pseudaminobacter sp.]|nr:dsDNA nuclease domain-containing protein [Pseudaminobacter sp.]